jgi:hypothetical protein
MELQVLSHFSKESTTCPYPEPAETIPRHQTLILSASFKKKLCMHKWAHTFRNSFQDPWTYNLSLKFMPHSLPISFLYLLFSTIFCMRQFRDSCVYSSGACGWKFISNSVTSY